jgi:hypothetical protein
MDTVRNGRPVMFKYQRERLAILRAFVEINKLQREAFGHHDSRDQNAMGIHAIITLGHLEGRPFNASNLSEYLEHVPPELTRKDSQGVLDSRFYRH